MINLNQLRVFKAVFEERSITSAARRLRISQPAVSKQLAELEASLGAALVDRLPRGIRLTAAGEVLEQHARRIFLAEASAEADLAVLLGLGYGRLAVGASTTIGSYLVPSVFGELHQAHPSIRLELEINNTHVIQQAVLEGRLDVGLTEGLASSESLEVDVFAQDEMIVITSPHHAWASRDGVEPAELQAEAVLGRERGSGSRAVVEAALAERGVELEFTMSLGSTEAVKNAVAQGLGIAIVSRLSVTLELEVGWLRAVSLRGPPIRRDLHRIRLRGKHPSPAASEFLRLLAARYGRAS
jgi:DNA-binding transcriptional LysR family regulator